MTHARVRQVVAGIALLAAAGLALLVLTGPLPPPGRPGQPTGSHGSGAPSPGRSSVLGGSAVPRPSGPPSAPPPGSPSGSPSGSSPGTSLNSPPGGVDQQEGVGEPLAWSQPDGIELYSGAVSVVPGGQLELHVSTPAPRYRLVVDREGYEGGAGSAGGTGSAGSHVVATGRWETGHDYRRLASFSAATRTARANWPATDRFDTTGWDPGVYVATANDSNGTQGQAIFVVRSPVLDPARPVFVFSAITYQAYNLWGGANLYDYAGPRATRVSFERPYSQDGGKGFWTRDDDRIVAWLERQRLGLQYTTDYDLALAPPDRAPRVLIFPRHTEYVPAGLRDWVERHVEDVGDMNVLNFGSNSFYWQVRFGEPATSGAPFDIVCYKSATADPLAAADPAHATTRWRDPPVSRAEGLLLGAQYVGVLADGFARFPLTVSAGMPPELLAGTGWHPGTVITGLLMGEGDAVLAGSGGIAVMTGEARSARGKPLATSVTIRVAPSGARIFDAGTFAWGDGFAPPRVPIGVSAASFERFNQNVLAWLGLTPRPAG